MEFLIVEARQVGVTMKGRGNRSKNDLEVLVEVSAKPFDEGAHTGQGHLLLDVDVDTVEMALR